MSKIQNDAYYTPKELAYTLCRKTIEIIGDKNIYDVIEPSAGCGAFSDFFEECESYDIDPKRDYIVKADFLTVPLIYRKGRLFIGNPPFGYRNNLAIKFYNRCCELGDYVAFVLPISQLNNNLQFYRFDLIYSCDLGVIEYSGVPLHCCFNIYKRPESGKFNPKPDITLKDVTIIEHRRKTGNYATAQNKTIAPNFDYAMCNWGSGCLGKVPEYVGQYAQEVYFYCHNTKYRDKLLDILQPDKIRDYVKSISAKKISVAKLYIYIKENIPELR